jgi:hypothetical protein
MGKMKQFLFIKSLCRKYFPNKPRTISSLSVSGVALTFKLLAAVGLPTLFTITCWQLHTINTSHKAAKV